MDREKDRERWRRNKRAQRARNKVEPQALSPTIRAAVMAERDRREAIAWRARREINGNLVDVAFRRSRFVADVWAARTLLTLELGPKRATPTEIARWLYREERDGDYKESSLRPMVYLALDLIQILETEGRTPECTPFWAGFDLRSLNARPEVED